MLALSPHLDERKRRLMVAAETISLGPRSIAAVSRATGMSRKVIRRGIAELQQPAPMPAGRVRRPGAGRKRAVDKDPTLRADLDRLVEPGSRGDPESPLRWTCKSTRKLAAELTAMGHQIGPSLVRRLLHEMGYSLQANRKVLEGSSHPDRKAQFEHINAVSTVHLAAREPVISVDTKKNELVGQFKNTGKELRPKGNPEPVLIHDFVTELGRVNPYGVYDVAQHAGWVSVGIDHDTAAFAVESIRRWWTTMGAAVYPQATTLLITADCGGSNGYRVRLWKFELQRLADDTRLELTVCHFPPGTSKWNKVEHRLFSFISQNWRGKPLISYQVIVDLIAATTTTKGLTVRSALDENQYEKGRTISDDEMATLNITPDTFHGEWNYTIRPRTSKCVTCSGATPNWNPKPHRAAVRSRPPHRPRRGLPPVEARSKGHSGRPRLWRAIAQARGAAGGTRGSGLRRAGTSVVRAASTRPAGPGHSLRGEPGGARSRGRGHRCECWRRPDPSHRRGGSLIRRPGPGRRRGDTRADGIGSSAPPATALRARLLPRGAGASRRSRSSPLVLCTFVESSVALTGA